VADDGTLWYGVKGKADQVYRRSQGTILRFKIADFPPAFTSGTALTVARDNTVWAVELYSGELFHYLNLEGDEHWRPAMVYPGHPDVHNVTSTPEGRIWLGTSRGLWFTDDRNAFIRVPDVSCVSVQAWCTAPRRIWVACGYPGVLTESLIHFDGVEWEIVPVGELYEITALVEAAPNELFVGTAQGRLQHWDGDDWAQIELPRKFALSPEPISAMAVGPEGIWMGTQGNGLFFYRLSNGSLQWEHISSDDGLPSNWISSLAVGRDGSLWVGTDSGVARWKDGDWHVYTIENGLTHNRVEDIDVAPGGEVWLSTLYGGISRYSSED
jgi:ligand-binding sensor domain-containing protein